MAEELGAWAAGLLIDEAWAAYTDDRYEQALAAASRAAEAAVQLDDPVLLIRALRIEASTLQLLGDDAAALARYTRIMGLAEDPATGGRLDDLLAAEAVADAYWSWVACARHLTGIPVPELFRVLDAGERWLTATGHRGWRASMLLERAMIHNRLGEKDASVAAAEEALAVAVQHPHAPGYSLNTFRYQLGDILRSVGRAAEAVFHYRAVLDDPDASPWYRRIAHKGLASCALEAGDLETARREASTAVVLAETLGDDALSISLEMLAEACRVDGDLDAAWEAATRGLEAAGRLGGHYPLYFMVRTAADIALDRADLAIAERLLGELDEHAAALDATTGRSTYSGETARRHQRLAELTASRSQQAGA